ncbi:MAG TPA: Trk system potassium transporter TrkA, partial [Gammaproteobacteria bacterium]
MKIIILGAGQVGSSLAANLVSEANDITVVDSEPKRLQELQDRLDLRTVLGHASHPDVLTNAGGEDADMIIAVTNSDETNMVACRIAATLFNTPTKIARIRAQSYLEHPQLFGKAGFNVDVLISPEQIVTNYISRIIEYPGALQVLSFAEGAVQLVAVRAHFGGMLVGRELRTLRNNIPNVDTRVAAIYRQDRPIIPEGHTVVEAGDEIFFIAATKHIRDVMKELRKLEQPVKRVMLAGGGNIGERLARALESRYQVKLIEHNEQRCRILAAALSNTLVLRGEATDADLLVEENISDTDVFCALTNDDEANIMSALLAKRLGAKKVMALINRAAYVDLLEGGDIDVAISPQQATIGSLLTHIRRGDVAAVHSLRRGAAEAIEAIAHGDIRTSKVVGRRIEELSIPAGITIGAIVRNGEVIIAHHDTIIQTEDHLIVFVIDKKLIPVVEKL